MKKQEEGKPNYFEQRGATHSPGQKAILPGGGGGRFKKFTKKSNFDKIKKKFDATGKLDLEDFGNTKDIGLFLDWYNAMVKKKVEDSASRDILEISKLLVKSMTSKTFIMGSDKKPTDNV